MATGGRAVRDYEDDHQLVSQFQQLSVRSPELLTVEYHTHRRSSKLTATVSWYQNDRKRVDSWRLDVRNLTWEQNDYDCKKKKFEFNTDVNDYELPLWFRPGNRYEVTVYGRQHKDTHTKVVYKKSIEFRTGEVLSKSDVIQLQHAAEIYNQRPSQFTDAECTYFYRNKSEEYFDQIFSSDCRGIMETYLKDASGDLRSPINGEICGLFFCANVNKNGQPFPYSPFGDTRVLIRAEEVLRLTPNMFFADFHCMLNNQDIHHVTVVLTKSGSSADQFCKSHLPKLDINSNPFLYEEEDGGIWVTSAVFVDVFVTEDLDLKDMTVRGVSEMEYNIPTRGLGKTSQGGEKGVKTEGCGHCDIFCGKPLVDKPDSYEMF